MLQRPSRRSPGEHARTRGPFAAALVARRQELRLTQVEVAELAGVARGPLVALESGRTASLDVLLAVLDVLGLHLELARGRLPGTVASVGDELAERYGLPSRGDADDG